MILDGKTASLTFKENLKEKYASLDSKATLAIVHFNDPASLSYLKGRKKMAEELNVNIKEMALNEDVKDEDLLSLIASLNNDNEVDGIIVDRPLPKHLNENLILNSILPNKDVDGYTNSSLGKLISKQPGHVPCTPNGAVQLAKYYNIDFAGKNVLVIGRSVNVGKPLALILLNENATVTIAHSKTKDLKEKCLNADIIFLAVGKANFLTKDMINESSTVIDIGINFVDGKLCGDASKDIYDVVASYSPVPGGCGVMTNVMLYENLYQAYLMNHGRN